MRDGGTVPRRARESAAAADSPFRRRWTWRTRAWVTALGWLVGVLLAACYRTFRIRIVDPHGRLERWRRGERAIYAFWHDALVMMLSEVATNYVQLRTYEERLQYAQQNVAIQSGSTQIAEDRFHGGVATELDLRQARSNLKQTESLIPPLVTGRRQANNALCILLGMPPDDLAARLAAAPIPKPPPTVANMPSFGSLLIIPALLAAPPPTVP